MKRTQIIEATAQDLRWAIPDDDDFKYITEAYVDYHTNGTDCAPEHTPDGIAHTAEFVYGDMGAVLKYMIIAATLGWKELISKLKPICDHVGWQPGDLKTTIQEIKTIANPLEDLYDKYCEPALAAVKATLVGQSAPSTASNSTSNFNIKILAQPSATFCRIVAYDPTYGNPGARRHLYLTKKSGNSYRVSLGGATVTSWYNEPFFESVKQAEDFIKHSSNANTSKNMTSFKYCITDKPVSQGTQVIISDLSNCVLIASDCGPAYIHRSNQYCVESLEEDLVENIEKHEELNPALFNEDAKLKPEVKDKINEIVDEFLKEFAEVEVDLEVQDIILTGSNASYNYTKDSDLDIHIVADTSKIKDTLNLHKVIYDAYKSAFNKKFEIELNKVPVEIYVETQDTPLVSNGIYSVIKDEWVKEPTKEDIPEVDQDAIDKAFKPWEKRYKALVATITDDVDDEAEIDKFIDALYELRGKGLSTDGEYSIENLVFKEMRNNGYLDSLKELRHQVIARRLSLHEHLENLSDYFNFLNKLS
jgi:predicted nucleotidyltransferase